MPFAAQKNIKNELINKPNIDQSKCINFIDLNKNRINNLHYNVGQIVKHLDISTSKIFSSYN